MKIGLFSVLFSDRHLSETLGYMQKLEFDAIELYSGVLAPPTHCDPDVLLGDASAVEKLKDDVKRHGMFISALNCSGNPISPIPGEAKKHHEAFEIGRAHV